MNGKKEFQRKFLWSSSDFVDWVNEQSITLKKGGFNVEPSEITHKLFHDVIRPIGFNFMVPKKIRGNRKFPKKQIF